MNKIDTAMSLFYDKGNLKEKPQINNKQINNEFKNMVLANIKENYGVSIDKNKEVQIFDEVDRLTSMVESKRPDLDDVGKLTMLDELFDVKFGIDKFRD